MNMKISGKEYIEREALIDFCKKIIHERWNETTAPVSWSHAYADFIDDINNQPTADVAPIKHSEWEEIRDAYRQLEGWMCKKCGRETKAKENYCPNCGAKMDEGEKK